MPNTLAGLLVFVALLLPGFAFSMVLRRNRPERQLSVFRETATIACASAIADLLALGAFALIRTVGPEWTPDVGALIRTPGSYLGTHYGTVFAWSVGLLSLACGLAALAGWLAGRRSTHPSTMSSWWMLFERWHTSAVRHVECVLDDGSYVAGVLSDWNTLGEDSPDRDLILAHPITYRPAGTTESLHHPASAVCVSARRIVTMFVTYVDPATSAGTRAVSEVRAMPEERADSASAEVPPSFSAPDAPSR